MTGVPGCTAESSRDHDRGARMYCRFISGPRPGWEGARCSQGSRAADGAGRPPLPVDATTCDLQRRNTHIPRTRARLSLGSDKTRAREGRSPRGCDDSRRTRPSAQATSASWSPSTRFRPARFARYNAWSACSMRSRDERSVESVRVAVAQPIETVIGMGWSP